MHINVVTVSSGWILQKISERMINNNKNPNVHMTLSHTPNFNADVNYYADLQNCFFGAKTNFDVAYFTHADENSKQWLINLFRSRNAFSLDGIVSMNKRYTDMIEEIGYDKNKLTTITPGQTYDIFPLKKTTIGIVSKGGYPGYGQEFIENVLKTYDFKNFNLRILGNGWENLIPIANERGISLELLSDSDYSVYPNFYHNIDYLLIPGLWTAGPMSMQEALSCGVPIIGSNVGFVNYEFTADYVFEPNDVNGLIKILDEIIEPKLKRRGQVDKMTWSKYSEDITNFILKLKNK
jgi:glycosyltransferase involved in cell wall biosynthesis